MSDAEKPLFDRQTIIPLAAGAVVVLLLLIVVSVISPKEMQVSLSETGTDGLVIAPPLTPPEAKPEPEETPTEPSSRPQKPAVTGTVDTYEEAIEMYAGMRFQFVDCRGTPGSLTMKKGTSFMLDNRDDESHKIAVGTASYTLGAYGYKIVTASETGTLNITCDGGGAAQIIVQP